VVKVPSLHRGARCARIARRETREYREYLSVEQRREAGCSVRRMQTDFYHGLLRAWFRFLGVGDSRAPADIHLLHLSADRQLWAVDGATLTREFRKSDAHAAAQPLAPLPIAHEFLVQPDDFAGVDSPIIEVTQRRSWLDVGIVRAGPKCVIASRAALMCSNVGGPLPESHGR